MTSARWSDALEERARSVLPAPVFDYLSMGAREGVTAAEAVAAWDRHRFAPHVLRDVRAPDVTTTVLGTPLAAPVAVAPTTLQRAVHPEGELAVARAVADSGSLMVVSSNAGTSYAEIGGTGVAWWLQAYLPQDRALAEPMLQRAVAAGARAVVLTVDTPVVGTKYDAPGPTVWDHVAAASLRVNFDPGYDDRPGAEKAQDLGPADIAWLGERTGLPVVVKGVLRPDDARRAVDAGAAAVWVSNHGGRQLDRAVSTASALPGVASAVGDAVEVYVDGGVRTGLHLVTATALGARAAFLGRPVLHALAVDGAAGVSRLLRELTAEMVEAMRLSGCPRLSGTPGVVVREGQTARDLR
jgi:4-hydroxymandelate oxidase